MEEINFGDGVNMVSDDQKGVSLQNIQINMNEPP